MADLPSSVHFQSFGGGGYSLPVTVLSAIGPFLRESLLVSLLLHAVGAVALRYEVHENASALRQLVVAADGVIEDGVIEDELAHLEGQGTSSSRCPFRASGSTIISTSTGPPSAPKAWGSIVSNSADWFVSTR